TAQDICGSVVLVTYSDTVSTGCGGAKVISRTWTTIDDSGNTNNAVQTITVRDAPNITAPGDLTLECPASTGTNSTGVATAKDAGSSFTVTYSDSIANTCGGAKVIPRTWTALNQCGVSASDVQMIPLQDPPPPVISCPPNLTLECPADTSTAATGV